MAVFTLRTLGLRGVAVVRDGQNVGLRLVVESHTASPTTEIRINPQHPSLNQRPDDHVEYDRMAAMAATGAGRSLSDGSRSRGATVVAWSTAVAWSRDHAATRPAIPFGWPKPQGSPKPSTAKRWPTTGKQEAVESAAALARPLSHNASAIQVEKRKAIRLVRRLPAGRTCSASTWAA
jgi:hypothetical protein